jgi:two-component system sensor histidine kinase/response regulator
MRKNAMPVFGKRPTLLVVDDSSQNIRIISELFKAHCRIIAAKNGTQAIRILHKELLPDLILLDIMMPGLGGMDVCRHVKSSPQLAEIPIIFVTSKSDEESIVNGFQAGAVDYVTKPFLKDELVQRVKTHLRLKQQEKLLSQRGEILEVQVEAKTEALKESNRLLKKINGELEIANQKMKDFDQAKMRFLQLISTAIRSPLVGITGVRDFLREDGQETVAPYVGLLSQAIERLKVFSEKALLVTRLQTHDYSIQKQSVPVQEILEDILRQLHSRVEEKQLLIRLAMQPHFSLPAEPDLFRICLHEILNNAVEHTPDKGFITVEFNPDEETPGLVVRDSGPGFSAFTLNHQFELFSTDRLTTQESGLGLAAARLIMEAHGGTLNIGNYVTGGATVRLIFQQ